MTTLRQRYRQLSLGSDFETDPAQLVAVQALEAVTDRIKYPSQPSSRPWLTSNPATPPLGLWLWGPVGRGKTLLMDLFFETVPEPHKQRLHFHHFMRQLHQDLAQLHGQAEPLALIATRIARSTRVLCFDEFFVSDIGDAMLLGKLFIELFQRGVFLVATSNQHPDQLYPDGLQRQRFLIAIQAIKQHCLIHSIGGDRDHRLRQLHQSALFLPSNSPSTPLQLKQLFVQFGGIANDGDQSLSVLGRDIPCLAHHQRIAWFSFKALCDGPRSQLDYIDLADRFNTLIISDIPALEGDEHDHWVVQGTEDRPASTTNQRRFLGHNEDLSRRFISLIDELYDRSVILIASCEVGIDQLYPGGALAFAFERTRSRLFEMQSLEYQQRQTVDEAPRS